MVDEDAYILLSVDQRLNTFCRKECPGRKAHWLNTWGLSRHLISMEKSKFYATWLVVMVLLVWYYAPPGQELVWTPAILNYEIYWGSELSTTLPVLLYGSTVHCPTYIYYLLKQGPVYPRLGLDSQRSAYLSFPVLVELKAWATPHSLELLIFWSSCLHHL